EDRGQRQRPGERHEPAEQREDEKRQEQNEREIAGIALAEDEMVGGAQGAQAGREVEYGLDAFERAGEIAGDELAQHDARVAVVDEPVVAAIERAHAADEARVVEERDEKRRRNERERQHQAASPHAHEEREHPRARDEREGWREKLTQPH